MIPAIRGTHDILPGEVERWQRVETVARQLFERYGYAEVRTPIIEREELFAKGEYDNLFAVLPATKPVVLRLRY